MVDVDVCLSSHLKEKLVRATDKRLCAISNIMLFKKQFISYSTMELKGIKQ